MTSSKTLLRAWTAVLMGSVFYCYQFILRVSPNVMTDELMRTFHVDAEGLAFIIAVYYIGYATMQLPFGVFMDKLGPRRIIAGAALLCGLGTFLFSIVESSFLAGFARLLIGIGSACGYLGTLKLGSLWLPRSKMPYVVGVAMMLGTAGASMGTLPLEILLNHIGWKASLQILASFGLVLSFCMLMFVSKSPPRDISVPDEQHLLEDLRRIFSLPQAWLIALFAMLMYVPIAVIGDLFGVSYLESKYGITEDIAAQAMIAMFVGIALGGPVFAWITERWQSRTKPMILGTSLALVTYLLILFIPSSNFIFASILFFLAGFFFNGQCISFSCICEIMPEHASGVAVGFLNMVVMFSGFVFLPIIGRILVALWDGEVHNGAKVYSAQAFDTAMIVIPICLILALLLLRFIKETRHHIASEH